MSSEPRVAAAARRMHEWLLQNDQVYSCRLEAALQYVVESSTRIWLDGELAEPGEKELVFHRLITCDPVGWPPAKSDEHP